MIDLNHETFLLYASKNYINHHMIQSEFFDDLKRLKYIKRLLNQYRKTGEIKEQLLLNHIIILSNVFDVEPTVNMLFFKVDKEDYPLLKTLLIYLNYLPDNLKALINGDKINLREIPVNLEIAKRLREI